MKVLALFGSTGVGKTEVAIAVAEHLREQGEDPVAISCDALQVYRGLEVLTGAASEAQRQRLEHRLLGIAEVTDEFSAGRFADLARSEIDGLLEDGRRPIVVGGTGLYMRAALSEMELHPPVRAEIRDEVERDIADRGTQALHAELPSELAEAVHPNDRKRIARLTELERAGFGPPAAGPGELWTAKLRHPTLLVGLVMDRDELDERIGDRVDAMVAAGAPEEVRRADDAGASRTARAAIGFDDLLADDVEAMKRDSRAYARRQITWMRKMDDLHLIDRTGRSDADVAGEIVAAIDQNQA